MVKELKKELREAITLRDAEAMRVIRNDCRAFMTNNTNEISHEQQVNWFKNLNREELHPLLFEVDSIPLGYAIERKIEDGWWLTAGILSAYRGKGYGEEIFRLMIERVGTTCYLEVRDDNIRAKNLYIKLGFDQIGVRYDNDDPANSAILTMKLFKPVSYNKLYQRKD